MNKKIVINLDRATERKQKIIDQFKKYKIDNFLFYPAVDGINVSNDSFSGNIAVGHFGHPRKFQRGEIACLMSHIGALTFAKIQDFDNIILFEDDVVLCEDFNERLKILLRLLPKNWDIIYLSAHTYNMPPPIVMPSLIPVNFKVSGAYSCMINNTAYDKIIQRFSSFETTTDDLYEEMVLRSKLLKAYIFFPFFSYPNVEDSYIWETLGNKIPHASMKYFKTKL